MKKLFYVLAITALTAFAACNDGEKTEETTPATETPATETPAPAQDTTAAPAADTTATPAQ